MYEEFFGFTAIPFSKTPDPAFLKMSKVYEEALAGLQYSVEPRERILLTGEVVYGKNCDYRGASG